MLIFNKNAEKNFCTPVGTQDILYQSISLIAEKLSHPPNRHNVGPGRLLRRAFIAEKNRRNPCTLFSENLAIGLHYDIM